MTATAALRMSQPWPLEPTQAYPRPAVCTWVYAHVYIYMYIPLYAQYMYDTAQYVLTCTDMLFICMYIYLYVYIYTHIYFCCYYSPAWGRRERLMVHRLAHCTPMVSVPDFASLAVDATPSALRTLLARGLGVMCGF